MSLKELGISSSAHPCRGRFGANPLIRNPALALHRPSILPAHTKTFPAFPGCKQLKHTWCVLPFGKSKYRMEPWCFNIMIYFMKDYQGGQYRNQALSSYLSY